MEEQKVAKFSVQDILPLALVIVVAGIGIAFGLSVLGDVKGDMTALSAEANATQDTIDAVGKFSSKLGLIVTVVVAAIVIGVLVTYLMVRQK
jgi:type II secretory pathway component PulF